MLSGDFALCLKPSLTPGPPSTPRAENTTSGFGACDGYGRRRPRQARRADGAILCMSQRSRSPTTTASATAATPHRHPHRRRVRRLLLLRVSHRAGRPARSLYARPTGCRTPAPAATATSVCASSAACQRLPKPRFDRVDEAPRDVHNYPPAQTSEQERTSCPWPRAGPSVARGHGVPPLTRAPSPPSGAAAASARGCLRIRSVPSVCRVRSA
jgi:hypothetical protein